MDSKQSHYKVIYSLFKKELSVLQAYIDKNLANKFIKPSKLPAGAFILFMSKSNKTL